VSVIPFKPEPTPPASPDTDPERVAAAIIDAHIKAITVALQMLEPHLVTVIERAISGAKDGDDTWRPLGDVVKDIVNKLR
jgi:hypothetical protein